MRKIMKLQTIRFVVLDEADEMLDMGFKEDLDNILADTPKEKRTLLFSATMSPSIYSIAKKFMTDPKEISVGNLDAKRDYTDVRDVVRAYRLLIERGKNGEVYNICSETAYSGQQILDTLISKSLVRIKIVQDPTRMRPSDTPDIYGDHSKITKDTGWQPKINFKDTLNDALEDWRKRIQ